MASGHVNRTNRPNTWLHRPATRREDSPCQLGAVHTWHEAAVRRVQNYVRFLGYSGREMLAVRLSHFDPDRTQTGWRVVK